MSATPSILTVAGNIPGEFEGDSFQATMTWTEPGQRYAAGQNVDLTLSVTVDEYKWYDDEPAYIHQGLNYVGADLYARIDEPGIDFIGATGSSIYFVDAQGEHLAQVKTDYGKIAIESQTLHVSAAFPSGESNGDEKTIYIKCIAGMNIYNYRWWQMTARDWRRYRKFRTRNRTGAFDPTGVVRGRTVYFADHHRGGRRHCGDFERRRRRTGQPGSPGSRRRRTG
jgi:hypothetical protein